ncbi:MAG: hypothetical protein JWM80_1274 [Cyanobacteria bacterium RYN_339]|nr:hypothetical protein [Cyanobacteria bacterium RYN_339]
MDFSVSGIKSLFSPPPVPPPPPPAPPPEAPVAAAPAAPAPVPVTAEPNASPEGARKLADQIFLQGDLANYKEQGDVSQRAVDNHDGAADLNALKQVQANEKLEHDALAKLPPAQQAQYKKLAKDVEDNPQAHMALQVLLLEGKLTGDPKTLKPDGKGQTLLDGLAKVHDGPLDPTLDKKELLGSLLRETAQPTTIKQGSRNTCTVTSLQIMTARSNPAEYVRIVAGMAAPAIGKDGKPGATGTAPEVELANGTHMVRQFGSGAEDGTGRSVSARLWQNNMMAFAASQTDPNATKIYNVRTGTFNDGENTLKEADGSDLTTISDAELTTAEEAATGKKYAMANRGGIQEDMIDQVKAVAARKVAIDVDLGTGKFNKQGSESTQRVTVTGVAADGTVTYKGADGKEATMAADKFRDRLHATYGHGPKAEPTLSMVTYDQKMVQSMQDGLKANPGGVPVGLKWGEFKPDGTTDPMGHEILVTKIEGGRVFYSNPHGDQESMGQQEFMNRIDAMSFQKP